MSICDLLDSGWLCVRGILAARYFDRYPKDTPLGGSTEATRPVFQGSPAALRASIALRTHSTNRRGVGLKKRAERCRYERCRRRNPRFPGEIATMSGRRNHHQRRKSSTSWSQGRRRLRLWSCFESSPQISRFAHLRIDLAQSSTIPARSANRTNSERLPACILVMTFAR